MKNSVHSRFLKVYIFNKAYYNYDLIVFIDVKHDTTNLKDKCTLFIKDNCFFIIFLHCYNYRKFKISASVFFLENFNLTNICNCFKKCKNLNIYLIFIFVYCTRNSCIQFIGVMAIFPP